VSSRVSPVQSSALLEQLRGEIRRIERRPARREGVVPCGLPAIDEALGGGFRRGALTELVGGPASGKTAAALALVRGLGPEALAAWVDARAELYPPAAVAHGVDLARLLVVRPLDGRGVSGRGGAPGEDPWLTALWAGEALLASGAFAAVVLDLSLPASARLRGAENVSKRLQAAVEKGGAVGLWLAAPGASLRLPAAARLELAHGCGPEQARPSSSARRASPGGACARDERSSPGGEHAA
jgi:protein ImuA